MEQLRLAWRFRGLDVEAVGDVTRLMTMSIVDLLDRFFESDQVKTVMALNGLIGTWAGPHEPGTGYVMAHHSIGDVGDGQLGALGACPTAGWAPWPRRSSPARRTFGAEIRTNARVASDPHAGRRGRAASCWRAARSCGAARRGTAIHPKITFLRAARPQRPAGGLRRATSSHWKIPQRRGEDQLRAGPRARVHRQARPGGPHGWLRARALGRVPREGLRGGAGGQAGHRALQRRRDADLLRPHARARGQAHRVAVHAVGAARVERGAPPRRARGLRRPRDRGLRRAGAGVHRQRSCTGR